MASMAARAERNRSVRLRLEAALEAISTQLGITVPVEPRRMRDANLQPIVELERFADFAEAVQAAIPEDLRERVAELEADVARFKAASKQATTFASKQKARIAELEAKLATKAKQGDAA